MKKLFLLIFLVGSLSIALNAENNDSTKVKSNTENNASTKAKENAENNESVKAKRAEKQIQEQMKREEKYAKEQTFYQGKDFDLSELEVDPNTLESIPDIEPDYSFNMDDVYD
ncbi:hypothetical protein ACLHDG_08360 [Sulfurovum sp. CS9]|uniref:hypothetical protein n=1 Tax=Sulfurovum sp. CS9 TaxID=3391146 RepID=UPI0039E9B6BF